MIAGFVIFHCLILTFLNIIVLFFSNFVFFFFFTVEL